MSSYCYAVICMSVVNRDGSHRYKTISVSIIAICLYFGLLGITVISSGDV